MLSVCQLVSLLRIAVTHYLSEIREELEVIKWTGGAGNLLHPGNKSTL